MKKILFSFALFFSAFAAYAQEINDTTYKTPDKKAVSYYKMRKKISVPPYGYTKIEKQIRKIKPSAKEDADGEDYILNDNTYNDLSLREKFTYNMIHPESYSQNSDVPLIEDDAYKKIYSYVPAPFNENYWSKRQTDFFKDNRDSVINLLKENIERSNSVGSNYKQVIIDLKAVELIPVLIKVDKKTQTDHDILTVLNLLMKDAEYEPFVKSSLYEKLYGNEDASYDSHISFNKENEELIIKSATDFYNDSVNKM